MRRIKGGMVLQNFDEGPSGEQWEVVSKRAPTEDEARSLRFVWKVGKHVKSNSIVLAQGTRTVGVGAGQMSRVDAARIAVHKAGDRTKGTVVSSDAFFPFPDAVEVVCEAGATAIIQPGGSMRDDQAIAEADKHDVAMVVTRVRHFRH
jgi:phosphoribosylaminoimidazolecarboxamide formyltransferase/IMP cyclohydrolase